MSRMATRYELRLVFVRPVRLNHRLAQADLVHTVPVAEPAKCSSAYHSHCKHETFFVRVDRPTMRCVVEWPLAAGGRGD